MSEPETARPRPASDGSVRVLAVLPRKRCALRITEEQRDSGRRYVRLAFIFERDGEERIVRRKGLSLQVDELRAVRAALAKVKEVPLDPG